MAHATHPAPATRPALEVADILRQCAGTYRDTHRLSVQQHRVVNALTSCRTAALGGFKACCDHCGAVTIQYASCRNRHCPKCQTLAQTRWVERQCAELLNISYWHVVFTLPHELNPIAQGNPALIYRLLFNAASKTLLEFGRNPRWLGGELGITMVLHTWGQNLGQHIHIHCVVTDGALSPDRERWLTPVRRGFLFPTAALSKVFRGKYLDLLSDAHRTGELRMPGDDGLDDTRAFDSLKTSLQSNDWVVYSKAPFAGAANVVPTLGRYRSAIAELPPRRLRWRACSLPMPRLRSRQQAQGDAPRRRRVHPPISPARARPRGITRLRHYGLLGCCFALCLVEPPGEFAGLFRRRIAWDDGAIWEAVGVGAVAVLMNRCCRSGEDVGARAPSVGKRWGSASFSRACPHGRAAPSFDGARSARTRPHRHRLTQRGGRCRSLGVP